MDSLNFFGIAAVKQELEDPLPNDHKSLFGFTDLISLPMEGSNIVNCFQDISTKLEPNCDPLKQELNVNVDSDNEVAGQ
ncbi:hypothetical protein QYM36_018877 [Artemia franciscana]|uniref:Uncharacterized protein n=1 Tax=Artemia franciscana TaxID=6661 RepID=A0AA88H615_ARTSF|nr:hypothetical protein QYM36_018877 [Artemia franciscana]